LTRKCRILRTAARNGARRLEWRTLPSDNAGSVD
jgi:hypothetical protein